MKKTIEFFARLGSVALSAIAIVVGTASVNSACMFWFHQPEVPKGMDKYKFRQR